jgi:dTMP kinase
LEAGYIVICDRFFDSTLAYQGYGRGLDVDMLKILNSFAINDVFPDLTILLDLPTTVSLQRRSNTYGDRFESKVTRLQSVGGDNFHEEVRKGFLELSNVDPSRWLVMDASVKKTEIADRILQKVLGILINE